MMQVLHWSFSTTFAGYYQKVCESVGREAEFTYIHDVAREVEALEDCEGLLLRYPTRQQFIVALSR